MEKQIEAIIVYRVGLGLRFFGPVVIACIPNIMLGGILVRMCGVGVNLNETQLCTSVIRKCWHELVTPSFLGSLPVSLLSRTDRSSELLKQEAPESPYKILRIHIFCCVLLKT